MAGVNVDLAWLGPTTLDDRKMPVRTALPRDPR